MSNIDEHGWSTLPDDVIDHTLNDIRADMKRVVSEQDIITQSPEEEAIVAKWRSEGLTWKDIENNLEIRRDREKRS